MRRRMARASARFPPAESPATAIVDGEKPLSHSHSYARRHVFVRGRQAPLGRETIVRRKDTALRETRQRGGGDRTVRGCGTRHEPAAVEVQDHARQECRRRHPLPPDAIALHTLAAQAARGPARVDRRGAEDSPRPPDERLLVAPVAPTHEDADRAIGYTCLPAAHPKSFTQRALESYRRTCSSISPCDSI